jgi:hypothetical protein
VIDDLFKAAAPTKKQLGNIIRVKSIYYCSYLRDILRAHVEMPITKDQSQK